MTREFWGDGNKPPLRHLHGSLERLGVEYVDVGRVLLGDLDPDEEPAALYLVSHPNLRANRIIARTLAPHVR